MYHFDCSSEFRKTWNVVVRLNIQGKVMDNGTKSKLSLKIFYFYFFNKEEVTSC